MKRRELQKLVGLMIASGALDTATGKVDVDKLQGRYVIDGGKVTRVKGGGADGNQDGKQGGGIG